MPPIFALLLGLGIGSVVLLWLYWYVFDPLLRRIVGALLGVHVLLNEQNQWFVALEGTSPVGAQLGRFTDSGSLFWRGVLCRFLQRLCLAFAIASSLPVTWLVAQLF